MDNFEDWFEATLKEGAIELGTVAYGATLEELQCMFSVLGERFLEQADLLIPYFTDDLRFVWLTQYSEPLHALDPGQNLPELVLQISEFLGNINEDKFTWEGLSDEDYREVSRIMAGISFHIRGIQATLSASLLRHSMGDFDTVQA